MLNVISKWVGLKHPEASTEDFSHSLLLVSGVSGVLFSLMFEMKFEGYSFSLASLAGFLSGLGLIGMLRAA